MKSIINTIVSKEDYWDKGMTLGIVLIILSILAKSNLSLTIWSFSVAYENSFDWLLVLFLGISIFFFFMGIRLNTEINENRNIDNLPDGKMHTNRQIFYKTYLDRFNILSKSSFTISCLFTILLGIKLLFLVLSSFR